MADNTTVTERVEISPSQSSTHTTGTTTTENTYFNDPGRVSSKWKELYNEFKQNGVSPTLAEILGADPEKYQDDIDKERKRNARRESAAQIFSGLGTIVDIASAGAGGNVYERNVDYVTPFKEKEKEIDADADKLRAAQAAYNKSLQTIREKAAERADKHLKFMIDTDTPVKTTTKDVSGGKQKTIEGFSDDYMRSRYARNNGSSSSSSSSASGGGGGNKGYVVVPVPDGSGSITNYNVPAAEYKAYKAKLEELIRDQIAAEQKAYDDAVAYNRSVRRKNRKPLPELQTENWLRSKGFYDLEKGTYDLDALIQSGYGLHLNDMTNTNLLPWFDQYVAPYKSGNRGGQSAQDNELEERPY